MATKQQMKQYKREVKENRFWGTQIPFGKLSVDECLELVAVNGRCLRYIPVAKRTKQVCVAAVENTPEALEYLPMNCRSKELCVRLYKSNVSVFPYLPLKMRTLDCCIDCYQRIIKGEKSDVSYSIISCAIPDEYHDDKSIFKAERKLGIRVIKDKKFCCGRFEVTERASFKTGYIITYFDSFKEFYKFVEKDLSEANLLEYDFADVDLNKIDISEAYVSAKVLQEKGLYDDTFYRNCIKAPEETTELVPYEPQELSAFCHTTEDALSDDVRKLYYISDLHLNHKLQNKFPNGASENEVKFHIKEMVKQLVSNVEKIARSSYLLIGGDISYNFQVAEMFFEELIEYWGAEKIVVVLGNHDLWNFGAEEKNPFDYGNVISKYRGLFGQLGIVFLENAMLITKGTNFWEKTTVITEQEILGNDIQWLKQQLKESRLTILGGIGFSGENQEFNAETGIYRFTIPTLQADKQHTARFKSVYGKVREAAEFAKVVVLTHTPIEDWSTAVPVSNWIYVNGHTHRNHYCIDNNQTIFADNQVGYYKNSLSLKHFQLTTHYDIFNDYKDGIYHISGDEYMDFHRGINVNMSFSRTDGKVLMLKREGLYLFLYQADNGRLYFLKGGSIRRMEHEDVSYYYETMVVYKRAMEHVFKGYHEAIKHISNQIQSIGGSGKIHGNIVDIDFLNHVYLDPSTGMITCYYADSISKRYVYPTIEVLLQQERKDLYLNHQKLCLQNKNEMQLFTENKLQLEEEAVAVLSDTSMYGPSNMFRSLQYMFDVNVIREWNEEVVEKAIAKYMGDVSLIGN